MSQFNSSAKCSFKKKLTYTSNLKFLGIHITEHLTWSAHIQYLCNSLSKAVYMVKALRNIVSQPVLRNIYFAKFQSKLRYRIIFWGAENSSKEVFIMQEKILQTIKGVNNRVSCRQVFKDYKILTLTSLYILEVLCYLKKNKVYNIQNKNVHNYGTRG
jgi:hypothetical protein